MVSVDRRQFLGLTASGTLAALAGATIGLPGSRALAAATTRTDFPAIVIGSGFGGSVAALRLGQSGVDTLILERGQQWATDPKKQIFGNQFDISNKMFWNRLAADWPAVPPAPMLPGAGVMEVSNESNLNIACGAAVGGGSIVYTGVTLAPPKESFETVYPDLSYTEFTGTWYPKVRAMLGSSVMPDDIYNSKPFTHSRVWDTHMRKAGFTTSLLESTFDYDVIRKELSGEYRASAIAGETDFGCSDGAKKSLTRNYLPAALATGKVQLRALHEVQTIGRAATGKYQIVVKQLGADLSTIATTTFTCDKLFVCAGTLNTSRLMVAARDSGALPNLNAEVGKGFGDNGDQFNLYAYTGDTGPTQGSPSRSGTFFPKSTFGIPMMAESWQLFSAQGLPIIHTLSMTADYDNRGTFTYDGFSKKVKLSNWTGDSAKPSHDAGAKLNQRILDTNPNTIPFSLTWPFTLTAHPLGGMVRGRATDLYGRVKGYDNLYVLDGALIPGTIGGANPSLSIAALAERSIAAIIRAGK
jgi:cholesterol oxidase